jgi:predicted SprT family Zn-dependent metalloprotease
MDEHGLTRWKIGWNRAKKTHGMCQHSTWTLTFSTVAFDHIGEAEVRETILHEIAHALVGPGHEHDSTWRSMYRRIGGTGGQFVSQEAAKAIPTAWVPRCPAGHTGHGLHRAPLRVKGCGQCSRTWKPETVMTWYHNGRRVPIGAMPVRYVREALVLRAKYGSRLAI